MALELLKDRYTEAFEANGFYTLTDFQELAKASGIKESRIAKIISEFKGKEESVDNLVNRSFLNDEIKRDFKTYFKEKLTRINLI